jgi:hypothetical protein
MNNLISVKLNEDFSGKSRFDLLKDSGKYTINEIFYNIFSLSKIGIEKENIPFNASFINNKLTLSFIREGQKQREQFIFAVYEKIEDYIESVDSFPLLTKCRNTLKVKRYLMESCNNEIKDNRFKRTLNKYLKEDKIFYNIFYNTKKENLIYKLWKNNYRYHSIVSSFFKGKDEMESLKLIQKFMNPNGYRILMNKRFNLFKDDINFVDQLFKEDLIFKMLDNLLTTNSLKNKEKVEIYNNISFLMKKYKRKPFYFKFNGSTIKNILNIGINGGSNSKDLHLRINYKHSLLNLLMKLNLKSEDLIAIKLVFYTKKLTEFKIKKIEDFFAMEKYHFQYRYDKYESIFKHDYMKKLSYDDIKKLSEYLMKEKISKNKKNKTRKYLYYYLISQKNCQLEEFEHLELLQSNYSILKDVEYIRFFTEELLEDWSFESLLSMDINSEFGWDILLKIKNNNEDIFYLLLNKKIVDFTYLVGNKIINIKRLPKEYVSILNYSSLNDFFQKNNIKNKRVRKEIFNKVWNENVSFFNYGMFNRIIGIKKINKDYDDQKILPLIDYFNILNFNYVSEMIFLLNKIFSLSIDKIIHYLIKSEKTIDHEVLINTFGSNRADNPYINLEHEIIDLHQMLLLLNNKLNDDNLTEEHKSFLKESIERIKKSKNKNLFVLHNKISSLLTKLNQVNYKLPQEKFYNKYNGIQLSENLRISVPLMNYDLIDVGEYLNVCVGNGYYSQKIIKDQVNILYLINNKDEIVACLEFNREGKCIQARGKNNRYLSDYENKNIKEIIEKAKKI